MSEAAKKTDAAAGSAQAALTAVPTPTAETPAPAKRGLRTLFDPNSKVGILAKKAKEGAGLMSAGLISRDRPTRKASRVFFFSLFGLLLTLAIGWQQFNAFIQARFASDHEARMKEEAIKKFFQKQRSSEFVLKTTLDLGKFMIEIKTEPGERRAKSVVNLAEVFVMVTCDEPETCKFMEENKLLARDQVTGVFNSMRREELLSLQGKEELKREIKKRLNQWLPKGKIEKVFFPTFIMG